MRAIVAGILAIIAAGARAEDIYAGVGPGTYCGWNRTGLPPMQQRICADFDKQYPPKQADWRTIEAGTGARYRIDLNSIRSNGNGSAEIIAYIVEDGRQYRPENLRRLWFDCKGRFNDLTTAPMGESAYAPPGSVIGQISAIACARTAASGRR